MRTHFLEMHEHQVTVEFICYLFILHLTTFMAKTQIKIYLLKGCKARH